MSRTVPMPTPELEGDVLAIRGQTPARCLFVFHAPAIMLKFGIAFLAPDLLFTIVIEPAHRRPGASSTGLPCLGTQPTGKSKLLRQHSRISAHRLEGSPFR